MVPGFGNGLLARALRLVRSPRRTLTGEAAGEHAARGLVLARCPHACDVQHMHMRTLRSLMAFLCCAGRPVRAVRVAGRWRAGVGLCTSSAHAHSRPLAQKQDTCTMQGSVQESTRTSPQHQRLGDAAMGRGQRLGTLGAADAPRSGQQASWPRAAASARASSTASQFSSTATVRGTWWAITDRIDGRSRCRRRTSITGTPQTPRASPVGHGTRARHSCAN